MAINHSYYPISSCCCKWSRVFCSFPTSWTIPSLQNRSISWLWYCMSHCCSSGYCVHALETIYSQNGTSNKKLTTSIRRRRSIGHSEWYKYQLYHHQQHYYFSYYPLFETGCFISKHLIIALPVHFCSSSQLHEWYNGSPIAISWWCSFNKYVWNFKFFLVI